MLKFIFKKLNLVFGKKNQLKNECMRICLIYMVIALLWVNFSDRLVSSLFDNKMIILMFNMYKGSFYILITTILLFILLNKLVKKVETTENELNKSNRELHATNTELQAYVQQLKASEEELKNQYDQILVYDKELKTSQEKLQYLSFHDQLTGLYNRRYFEQELARLDREGPYPFTIIMADINGLKLINDSFGHQVGDEYIRKVGEVLEEGCRESDIICRLAGDEFIILSPNTEEDEGKHLIKRIKEIEIHKHVRAMNLSISFGYCTKNTKEELIIDVLKKAENYMYRKKLYESPSMRGKMIQTIITTLHEKNTREEQHSRRVSEICGYMGHVLNLSEDDIRELKTVGLLHDIGKVAIDENILNKEGKLTNEEWEELKKHPEIGYRILSTVNEFSEMAEYVLAHHERWDGTGYPKGLSGKEIPLQSRIITIADAYDAMISDRSYRKALPKEYAMKELKLNAGSQFDKELVDLFIEKIIVE